MNKYYFVSILESYTAKNEFYSKIYNYLIDISPLLFINDRNSYYRTNNNINCEYQCALINWKDISEEEYNEYNKIFDESNICCLLSEGARNNVGTIQC